jgi:hypothetical protein
VADDVVWFDHERVPGRSSNDYIELARIFAVLVSGAQNFADRDDQASLYQPCG